MSATFLPPVYTAQLTIIDRSLGGSAGAGVQAIVEGLGAALACGVGIGGAPLLALRALVLRRLLAGLHVGLRFAPLDGDLLIRCAGDAAALALREGLLDTALELADAPLQAGVVAPEARPEIALERLLAVYGRVPQA